MDLEAIVAWGEILPHIAHDEAVVAAAVAANPWFTPSVIQQACAAMQPWFDKEALAALRAKYPTVESPRRIGLILAGNLPLVGLHDLLMVLLAGHRAVVKPSHKDRVLLQALLARSSASLQARVEVVEVISPDQIDFLIATGSDRTAATLAEVYASVPHLIRHGRFSVARLTGGETAEALAALSGDILSYHGMGCRSVACLLVPADWDAAPLCAALEATADAWMHSEWTALVRYARALSLMRGATVLPCTRIVLEERDRVEAPPMGVVFVVRTPGAAAMDRLLAAAATHLQVVVGEKGTAFGMAQCPTVDDFADGVDTLDLLTHLS